MTMIEKLLSMADKVKWAIEDFEVFGNFAKVKNFQKIPRQDLTLRSNLLIKEILVSIVLHRKSLLLADSRDTRLLPLLTSTWSKAPSSNPG